jgi:predicted nucleic acid-binding protein
MPRTTEIVINASPTIALVAALGSLQVLQMYRTVWVPFEVCAEITTGGAVQFAVAEFEAAHWLRKMETPATLSPALVNTLDVGEAAVIQLALDRHIQTVCIDETVGRRMARLHGLSVTGSIGVLLRAKEEGFPFSMRSAIQRMQARGIWLSAGVVDFALTQAGEQ